VLLCGRIVVLTFVAIGLLRIPLVWVLLSLGVLSCALAYRALRSIQANAGATQVQP
jgi:chromate transporter